MTRSDDTKIDIKGNLMIQFTKSKIDKSCSLSKCDKEFFLYALFEIL